MSNAWLKQAWAVEGLRPTEKLVLIRIADHADDAGRAFPGFDSMARTCCMHRTTVIRNVASLEQRGIVNVQRGGGRRPGSADKGRPNTYTLNSSVLQQLIPDRQSQRATVFEAGTVAGCKDTVATCTDMVAHCTVNGSALLPEPSLEPPAEPSGEPSTSCAHPRAERFDEFWKQYPNKQGKERALTSWKKQKLDGRADEIIADVQARLADPGQWMGKENHYIPYGNTYINQKRFDDEWRASGNAARLPREDQETADTINAKAVKRAEGWK